MSQKTKALLAASVAAMSVAVAPVASLAVNSGAGVHIACQGGGGSGGCAG